MHQDLWQAWDKTGFWVWDGIQSIIAFLHLVYTSVEYPFCTTLIREGITCVMTNCKAWAKPGRKIVYWKRISSLSFRFLIRISNERHLQRYVTNSLNLLFFSHIHETTSDYEWWAGEQKRAMWDKRIMKWVFVSNTITFWK